MLKEFKLKKYLKYIPLFLIMALSMLLINVPKTYGWTGYYSSFGPYVNEVNKGEILSIGTDPMLTIVVKITHGPAANQEFQFIGATDKDDPGAADFANDGGLGSGTYLYKVGDKVFWNIQTQLWEIDTLDLEPVLNGETAFVTNIDAPISIDEIKSRITAIDNEDGNITHLIQIDSANSTYNTNITTIGTYDLKLFVIDTAGNRADLTVHVLVKDIAVPVITGTKTYNQTYTTKKDVGTILAALSATDNYDSSVLVKVKTDNYTANYNKIGSYNIIFNATDTSGNEGLYTVTVNVIDDVKPIFTGPTSIMKGQTQTLTLTAITSQVTVSDFIDKNVVFTVKSDGYTGKGHIIGSYNIVLEAVDSSGNVATHTITINVQDNIPPVFFVDNFFIHVDDVVLLTRQDIIDLLVASGQLTIQATTTINFSLNEYEGNESVPGIYAIVVNSASTDGTAKQVSLAVEVESTTDNDGIIVEPNNNFFTDVWTWLKTPTKEAGKFFNGYYIIGGILILGIVILIFKPKKYKKYRRY